MHLLRQWAEGIEGLGRFIDTAMGNPVCQGVVLDLNPIWLAAWRAFAAGLDPLGPAGWVNHPLQGPLGLRPDGDPYIDLQWSDDEIGARISAVFRRKVKEREQPFLVKAVALPIPARHPLEEARRQLTEIVREAPFPAILETRPPAVLAVACGDNCTTTGGQSGTIGGFLRDNATQKIYAATCGHVVPTRGASVSAAGAAIGTCAHTQPPTVLQSGQHCRPQDSCVSPLDLALIDVGTATVVNAASGLAAAVYPAEDVQMHGAATSTASYVVGGVCLTYVAGGACFDTLFEVRPPVATGVVARIRQMMATVPQQGDSGAWVERKSTQEWCGVLIAVDSQQGYVQEASSLMAAADKQFGTNLVLV
jgi:hypothetical protein